MQLMQDTIHNFVEMIKSVAGERDFDRILEKITQETIQVSSASGAIVYLMNNDETQLTPACCVNPKGENKSSQFSALNINMSTPITKALTSHEPVYVLLDRKKDIGNINHHEILDSMGLEVANVVLFPLKNRQFEQIGLLCLLFDASSTGTTEEVMSEEKIEFVKAVTGFSALTIEGGQMIQAQKDLLEAFIKLIAGAIDEKSPYTGGHCQRVPVLTKMLAQAACDSTCLLYTSPSPRD